MYSSVSGLVAFVITLTLSNLGYSIEFSMYGISDAYESERPLFLTAALIACILIKIPLSPCYHWLLRAHVEANTSGSILLAGIMLKIPAVGLVRILMSLQYTIPDGVCAAFVVCSIFTVVSGVSQLWSEGDIKRIVALSSVVHMAGSILTLLLSDVESGPLISTSVLTALVAHSF